MKWYVVTIGRKLGLFQTKEEVIEVTKDFTGASFKTFSSKQKAEVWFGNTRIIEQQQLERLSQLNIIQCHIDGSFSKGVYAYAYAFVQNQQVLYKNSGIGKNNQAATRLTSQAAELKAAMQATVYAVQQKYSQILIYHDNESVQDLVTGKITPKNEFTRKYVEFMKNVQRQYGIKIDFTKVKAHNGNKFNELVDQMARHKLHLALESLNSTQRPSTTSPIKRCSDGEVKRMLTEIKPIVEKHKHELQWYGKFLLDIYDLVKRNYKISEKQKMYVLKGYQMVKKDYAHELKKTS